MKSLVFYQGQCNAVILLMQQKKSLTPAQIQYLRIGPKVCSSSSAAKQLSDALGQYHSDGSETASSLASISKFTYGHFEHTVNNFGVLLHRNFVGASSLLQTQKFGAIAQKIDKQMQDEKDKPQESRRSGQRKSLNDNRTSIKGIYDFRGLKLLLTLKSFSIENVQTHRVMETLQLPFIRLLVGHVSSGKLVKAVEGAMRQEGATITIDYERMEAKIGHSANSEARYQEVPYIFERSGQQLAINLPYIELLHSDSDYRQNVYIENQDILDIIESDFDNVEQIVHKYFDLEGLEQQLGKTGVDRHSLPQEIN